MGKCFQKDAVSAGTYTEESLQALADAIAAVEAVYEDEDATEEDTDSTDSDSDSTSTVMGDVSKALPITLLLVSCLHPRLA